MEHAMPRDTRAPRQRFSMARFPRLQQIREAELGWNVTDIFTRLPGNRPSVASIYRLERGEAIRLSHARRVFDVVNKALDNTLNPNEELEVR
jgi:hypothetical protein